MLGSGKQYKLHARSVPQDLRVKCLTATVAMIIVACFSFHSLKMQEKLENMEQHLHLAHSSIENLERLEMQHYGNTQTTDKQLRGRIKSVQKLVTAKAREVDEQTSALSRDVNSMTGRLGERIDASEERVKTLGMELDERKSETEHLEMRLSTGQRMIEQRVSAISDKDGEELNEVLRRMQRELEGHPNPCPNYFDLVGETQNEPTVRICLEQLATKAKCNVLSFGVDYNFIFEDAMLSRGCEVRSFDPSMRPGNYSRGPHHKFYHVGIGGHTGGNSEFTLFKHNTDRDEYQVKSLITIMNEEAFERAHVRIDTEGAEWDTLDHWLESNIIERLDQLLIEVHFYNTKQFGRYARILRHLKTRMELFWMTVNVQSPSSINNGEKTVWELGFKSQNTATYGNQIQKSDEAGTTSLKPGQDDEVGAAEGTPPTARETETTPMQPAIPIPASNADNAESDTEVGSANVAEEEQGRAEKVASELATSQKVVAEAEAALTAVDMATRKAGETTIERAASERVGNDSSEDATEDATEDKQNLLLAAASLSEAADTARYTTGRQESLEESDDNNNFGEKILSAEDNFNET